MFPTFLFRDIWALKQMQCHVSNSPMLYYCLRTQVQNYSCLGDAAL